MTRVTIVALALFYALCYFASSLAVTFQDCGSKSGKFTEILVSGCEMTQENCILKRGTNASISIKFIPNKDISQVKVRVYGVLVHVPVPFPFQKSDACNDPDDGITCPLKKNQEYHYTTTLFVEKKYPKVNVDIEWELVDEANENIVCIEFPAKIQ